MAQNGDLQKDQSSYFFEKGMGLRLYDKKITDACFIRMCCAMILTDKARHASQRCAPGRVIFYDHD